MILINTNTRMYLQINWSYVINVISLKPGYTVCWFVTFKDIGKYL